MYPRFPLFSLAFMALIALNSPAQATDMSAAEAEYRATMETMHHGMMVENHGQVDTDFARGMIPHHQGAVEMAETVLKYGNDATIRSLAKWIKTAQISEIAQMKLWLSRRSMNTAEKPATIPLWDDAMMKMHAAMNIEYSGNADEDFVCGMIPHHQGAIAMAEIVLAEGRDPEMIALSRGIIRSQSAEIATMQRWLSANDIVCKKSMCEGDSMGKMHH
jgi:uncharacterized protein (DUF305 family)